MPPHDVVPREDYDRLQHEVLELRRTQDEAAELEREIRSELEADIERHEADNRRLKSRIAALEEQLEDLQTKLRSSLAERSGLNQRLEDLRESERRLKRQSVTLEVNFEELESNLRIKDSNTTMLEDRYATVVEECAFLLARAEAAEEQVQRLREANRDLEDEISAMATREAKMSREDLRLNSSATLGSAESISGQPRNYLTMKDDELRTYIKTREEELSRQEKDLDALRKLLRSRTESKLKKLRNPFASPATSPRKGHSGGANLSRRISRLFTREHQ